MHTNTMNDTNTSPEVAKLRRENEALRRQARAQHLEREARAAIEKAGGNVALLLPAIRAVAEVDGDDERLRITLHDERGDELLTRRAGSAAPMGLSEYLEQLRTQDAFAPAFARSRTAPTASPGVTPLDSYDLLMKGNQKLAAALAGGTRSGTVTGEALTAEQRLQRANDAAWAAQQH